MNDTNTPTKEVPDLWPDARPPPGFFDLFRVGQYPTLYPENKTPVTADVLESGFIYAAVILAFSLLIILPGVKDRLSTCIRIVVFVFVLASIMICNFGQEWEVAHLYTKTPYRAGLHQEIHASVGVKIGLRSVNITLKGDPVVQPFEEGRVNETINYNERLSWDNHGWLLGRAGFGPYAGKFNQEFREHQRRGSPYPILWVAEYFTIDGEGIRWGRYYLQAGYYAHIMVWTALPLWILSSILFNMLIRYGGYFSVLTGASLLSANIIYACVRNPNQLKIPFEAGFLEFSWGWSFILCAITGTLCCIIGIVVVILDWFMHEKLSDFFDVDITKDLEEFYLDPGQDGEADRHSSSWGRRLRTRRPTILLKSAPGGAATGVDNGAERPVSPHQVQASLDDVEMQVRPGPSAAPGYYEMADSQQEIHRGYRRRTNFPLSISQKKKPRPAPPPRGAAPPPPSGM